MRKQWVALLSMLGLTGSGIPLQSQVLKGSTTQRTSQNAQVKTANDGSGVAKKTPGKLDLNQQTLRQQNQGSMSGGKKADPLTPSAYCNANKAGSAKQLTPPPPGGNQQITRGNNAVTKGGSNQAVTKGGNHAITKGNNAITKGGSNQAITKGGSNQALTKGRNNAVTKGSAVQTTAAAGPK